MRLRNEFVRLIALVFVVSIVASPHALVMATEQAPLAESTPVSNDERVNEPEEPGDSDILGDDNVDSDAADESSSDDLIGSDNDSDVQDDEERRLEDAKEEASPATSKESESGLTESGVSVSGGLDIQASAEMGTDYDLYLPEWDFDTNELTTRIIFEESFTADEGDTFSIGYPTDKLHLTAGRTDPETFPISVTVDQHVGEITFTVTEDWSESIGVATSVWVHIAGEVTFPACEESTTGYINQQTLVFIGPDGSDSVPVVAYGGECPATPSTDPPVELDRVWFAPGGSSLELGFYITDHSAIDGQQVAITYPQNRIVLSSDPVNIYDEVRGTGEFIVIGSAVALDGVITATFFSVEPDLELWGDPFAPIPATLMTTCDPGAGTYFEEFEPLPFTGTPGATYFVNLGSILCNAEGPSKSGEFSDDGSQIIWTIDSGDIIGGGYIYDDAFAGGIQFDCSTLELTPITPDTSTSFDCDTEWFDVDFWGSDIVRVHVTIVSDIDPTVDVSSYLNCAYVGQGFFPTATTMDSSLGHGGQVCAELFPETGGDFITMTASADEVEQGDSLTYTVTVSTTATFWSSIELTDVLPAGFEVTNVECTAVPAELVQGDCYSQNGDTIIAVLYQDLYLIDEGTAGELTLEIEGVINADPGTELVNEACSVRTILPEGPEPTVGTFNMGNPEIPGGGVICATASTLVLQADEPDPDPTETPSPPATPDPTGTPDPTVPVDPVDPSPEPTDPGTPGASPTAPAEPDARSTATSAVTGLPETGSGAGASAIVIAALAASMLMGAAVGIRVRTLRA